MKIRAGYEVSYECPQPIPMILTLSIHPSRFSDLLTPDRMRLDPPIPANTYHDSFGNFCHVIRAPAGRLTFSTDFLVQDKGELDATARRRSIHSGGTSSAQTRNPDKAPGPKVWVRGTSAASRPCAMRTRPIRGALLRGSNVRQRPPR